MRIERSIGVEDLALVHLVRLRENDPRTLVECVESVQPPLPRERKWVLIVSSLLGCPIRCPMCDAGGSYRRRLTAEEILAQVELMVRRRYGGPRVPVARLKVQLARMGEPLLNPAVPEVLERLLALVETPSLEACLSTVAPAAGEPVLEEVRGIKDRLYAGGRFQLQFSIHSTDEGWRSRLMPARRWDLPAIAHFGRRWHRPGDRKISLNFTAVAGAPIEPEVLARHFDPRLFLVKLTPLNPTARARRTGLASAIDARDPASAAPLARALEREGFQVIVSIGEERENLIGSNCGQYASLAAGADAAWRPSLEEVAYTLGALPAAMPADGAAGGRGEHR